MKWSTLLGTITTFAVLVALMSWLTPVPAPATSLVPHSGSFRASAADAPNQFVAMVSGAAEVPPVDTRAKGEAVFTLSEDGATLNFVVKVSGISDVVASHIHLAPAGVNGPVVANLFIGQKMGEFSGVLADGVIIGVDLRGSLAGKKLSDLVAEILAGNTYVYVHTSAHPGGEIRGQVQTGSSGVAGGGAATRFIAELSGANEVPPVDTMAKGRAVFDLNKDGATLDFTLDVSDITDAVAAHIHLAPVGVNGPVVALLFMGQQTGQFSGVLARGMITSADLRGPLYGMMLSDLVAAIITGNAYVNVHTIAYPGGEIRGQVQSGSSGYVGSSQATQFVAMLSGMEEVPPTASVATGQAMFNLSADGQALTFTLTVANITNAVAAHIHLAPIGVNGAVVVPLFSGQKPGEFTGILAQGTITSANLTGALLGMPLSALIAQINAGNTYVNVHTVANPGGDIRGQIRPAPAAGPAN